MKSKRKETPNPTSELIIYTMNLEKEQKKYIFYLYDMGDECFKIVLEENEKYGIIIKFDELKLLNNHFEKFNTFEQAKNNIIELCKSNSIQIYEIRGEEISLKFELNKINNNEMIISLKKINFDEKEEIALIKASLREKDKEINELKTKINNLEIIVSNLSKKIEFFESKPNNSLINNPNSIIVENSNIIRSNKELKLLLNTIKPKDGNKLLSLKLLYNSDIEGENEEKFKSCFIGKNDIIIFIETKEYKRFGGYAHEAFKDYEGFIQKDSNAFLFNLDKLKIYKYKSKGGGYTIWNNDGNSMDFGGGVDLRIFYKFFSEKNYTSETSNDYEYSNEKYPLNGEKYFDIEFLELYQVIFNQN